MAIVAERLGALDKTSTADGHANGTHTPTQWAFRWRDERLLRALRDMERNAARLQAQSAFGAALQIALMTNEAYLLAGGAKHCRSAAGFRARVPRH